MEQSHPRRRDLVGHTALGLLGVSLARCTPGPRPAESLTRAERDTLSVAGEALVPGAAAAKIDEYVASRLGSDGAELSYRFLAFPMPALQFYRSALLGLDRAARAAGRHGLADLTADERAELMSTLATRGPDHWTGPPPGLVYFVLRNDALDVVYGGAAAYQALDVPYMAHIPPPAPW